MALSTTSSLTQWKERQQQCAEQVDLQALLSHVRSSLRTQGLVTWVNVSLALERAQSESGGLTNGALKRLLNDCRVSISDVDARALVQRVSHNDEEGGAGAVKNLIFGALAGRKLEFVQSAFDALDRKGVGYLALQDILTAHDAGQHPAVMFGEQTTEQVAREFQTAFMTATRRTGTAFCVAAQAPSDEYFELLMKRTDGDAKLTLGEFRHALQKSYEASSATIQNYTSLSDADLRGLFHHLDCDRTGAVPVDAALDLRYDASRHPDVISQRKSEELCFREFVENFDMEENGLQGKITPRQWEAYYHNVSFFVQDDDLFELVQLRRAAGRSDEDFVDDLNDGNVGFHDFVRALKSSGVHVTGRDAQSLFYHFDSNHDGTMSVTEFLTGVREPMNARRQLVVRMAFDALDGSGNGELDAAVIATAFDARRLPEVTTGRKTECEAHAEFLDTFGLVTERQRQRRVNFDVWERYYINMSAAIDEDEQFELMVRSAWHVRSSNGGQVTAAGGRAASADGIRVTQRQDPGRSSLHEVLDHSAANSSTNGSPSSGSSPSMTLRRARNNVSSSIAACLGTAPLAQPQDVSSENSSGLTSPGRREFHLHPAGVQSILSRLKKVLQAQGAPGFCTLNRRLRATRGNAMNVQDLRNAASECGLTLPGGLTDADLRLLFQYLDNDGDGRIAPDELINIVRPVLTGRRLDCVREAFAKLAKARNNSDVEKALLEPSDVVEEFDASAHPDVLAGHRGIDHVYREFLETFDIDGGAQDGKVSWEQWCSYYHNVSASVASDHAFEEMVCSVWHLTIGGNKLSFKGDLDVETVTQPQQPQDNQRGRSNGAGIRPTSAVLELPVRKILSLKDVTSGTGVAEASQLAASRGQPLAADSVSTYAGDTVLHAIRYRIRQSSSLADVVQLRSRISQAADPRSGVITCLRCCDALNAALGLALGEAQGRALFENLSHSSQANGDDINISGTAGARFLQQQHRVNGYDSSNNRLPLRVVLGCLLERLSPACLASATQVYSALQTVSKGRVFPAALASSFQAARHPDVVLGRATVAQVFQDFALNFEVAGTAGDGVVSFQHFETYCVNLRATLGSDDLLQMVLRDCFSASSN
uniref:EF-hand domain-containing protein n=1 Tax=Phytophthora ramorum TaxID=164328 RepID=H3GC98_PHYRM